MAMSAQSRPSRMEMALTPVSVLKNGQHSLSALMDHLQKAQMPGPYLLHDCHQGSRKLGFGAQFEVFGRRVQVTDTFEAFDGPYLDQIHDHGEPVPYATASGKTRKLSRTIQHVAVKRAYVSLLMHNNRSFSGHLETGQAVSASQLRDTIQEVLALTHPPLRQHPNIVRLIAWGYDRRGESDKLFSPVLFIEHAAISLAQLCKLTEIPWSVKEHLCADIAAGLDALHECGIVHGDIKPDNVLVFAGRSKGIPCVAKLADFGFSILDYQSGAIDVQDFRGTEGWIATDMGYAESTSKQIVLQQQDIYSCALTIWSVMALRGVPPNPSGNPASKMQADFGQIRMPAGLKYRLQKPLSDVLRQDSVYPRESLKSFKQALHGRSSAAEIKDERFLDLFRDKTDWEALERFSRTEVLLFTRAAETPATEIDNMRKERNSWLHDMRSALDFVARDQVLLQHLSTEEVALPDLFNFSMAYAIEGRPIQELETLYKCASGGYLAAQAIYPHILSQPEYRSQELVLPDQVLNEMTLNAIASGYLFASPPFHDDHNPRVQDARRQFRCSGGYNTHYCSRIPAPEARRNVVAAAGLLGNLEEELHKYPIHLAAAFDELSSVSGPSSLLDAQNMVDFRDRWGDTPIMKCCMAGHLRSLRVLIEQSADASLCNHTSGLSAAHWLFVFPDEEVEEAADLLVRGGARFGEVQQAKAVAAFHFPFAWPSGEPIHWATFANKPKAVETLVARGANVNAMDTAHQTSLYIAMKMCNAQMVRLLLSKGANLRSSDVQSDGTLEHWSGIARDPLIGPIHDFLWAPLELGGDPDMDDFDPGIVQVPPIYDEMIFHHNRKSERAIEVLQVLISHESECLTWRDSRRWTCLHYALAYGGGGDAAVIQFLLDHGTPINDVNGDDVSVLESWFSFNILSCGRRSAGSLQEQDSEISRLFEQLLISVPFESSAWLLNRREPSNPFNSERWPESALKQLATTQAGWRPIHNAARLGYPTCLKTMLAHGADPNVRTDDGQTALDIVMALEAQHKPNYTQYGNIQPYDRLTYEEHANQYRRMQDGLYAKRAPGRALVRQILQEAQQNSSHIT